MVAGATLLSTGAPRSVLEIGSAFGGSLWYWARLAEPDARIMSIDIDHSQLGSSVLTLPAQTLSLREGRSDDPSSLSWAREFFGGSVDFLFIDGAHEYDAVARDFEMYWPLVKKGGWCGFHDVSGPMADVARFWSEIRDRHVQHVEIQIEPVHHMGIGMVRK